MKSVLLLSVLFVFSSAMATTVSESTAKNMVTILKSKAVKKLLKVEDGVGNLKGIEYVSSGRAAFGPVIYRVKFTGGNALGGAQVCESFAEINHQTNKLMKLSKPACRYLED